MAKEKTEAAAVEAEAAAVEAEAREAGQDPEEIVEYKRPLDLTGRTLDLVVGVNGEMIRIRNGETVRIKRKFLEAIEHAERQRHAAFLARKRAEEAARKAFSNM